MTGADSLLLMTDPFSTVSVVVPADPIFFGLQHRCPGKQFVQGVFSREHLQDIHGWYNLEH